MARWTRRVGWFTGALVVVSVVTAWIFKGQLNVMQVQFDEIKKQSNAIERQSFAGRAYLFPRYVFYLPSMEPQTAEGATDVEPGDAQWLRKTMTYCIDNLGQTPGIITAVEAHLYLPSRRDLFLRDDFDLEAPQKMQMRETYMTSTVYPDGWFDAAHGFRERVTVPGNARYCNFKTTFVYRGRSPDDAPSGVHEAIFYIYITYKDIFGAIDRHTWYEVRLGGAGSTPGSQKYNHWD